MSLALGLRPGLGLLTPTRMMGRWWEVRGGGSWFIYETDILMCVGFCSQVVGWERSGNGNS